jgi:hypothetical protein
MIQCPECNRWLKTTAALRRHITMQHKNNGSEESFSNGITKDEFTELKMDVEELKWALKPYIHSQKRKQQNEEHTNEHKTDFSACLDELREKLREV